MKDEQRSDRGDERSWFHDQGLLLQELKKTPRHWGEVPLIPGYDRLVELRRGGQGVVYRARQQSTDRPVAIKVLLDGAFASEENRLRFQREIEGVARLRHPHIVRIYDSGFTSDGSLYYAMEHVEGTPLDERSRIASGHLNATLQLFVKVCDAVRHAHRHGVIHRDLKPNNILVDEKGDPHVLDFGLAKFTEETPERADESGSSLSRTGQFFGSLAWASPEQFEQSPEGIDLRADLYSIGVILYQVLTGRLPHTPSGNLHRTIERIVSEKPEAPRRIRPQIPADVETVMLRCLAKEPDRRYQSAGELLRDLHHIVHNEPIDAKRDRTLYVLRKTLARHKTVAALATLALLLLFGFALSMAVLYPRALRAEKEARENLASVITQTARAEAVRNFLTEMLSLSDPFVSEGRQLTLRDMLDAAALRMEGSFTEHPLVEAEIRGVIGEAYYHLGNLDEAEEHDRIALELLEDQPETVPGMMVHLLVNRAFIDLDRQRFDEAEAGLQRAMEFCADRLGEQDPRYGDCLHGMAQLRQAQFRLNEAGELYEKALSLFDGDDGIDPAKPRYLACMIQWAGLLISMRDLDRAVEMLDRALEIVDRNPRAHAPIKGVILFYLGLARFNMGNHLPEAEAALQEAMECHLNIFPEEHPRVAEIVTQLGHVRREQRRFAESEGFYRKALSIYTGLTGRESQGGASALWNIGQSLWYQERHDEAETAFKEAIAVRRVIFGPDHHYLFASLSRLGLIFCEVEQWDKALPYLRESAILQENALGADHPFTARAQALLGECLARLQCFEEGEQLLLRTFRYFENNPGGSPAHKQHAISGLVELYTAWDKPDQAAKYEAMINGP